jgi:hypothetical protein
MACPDHLLDSPAMLSHDINERFQHTDGNQLIAATCFTDTESGWPGMLQAVVIKKEAS